MSLGKFIKRALAESGSDIQADLMNNWAAELYAQCEGKNNFEAQCCDISNDLDASGRLFIKTLAGYVTLLEEGE